MVLLEGREVQGPQGIPDNVVVILKLASRIIQTRDGSEERRFEPGSDGGALWPLLNHKNQYYVLCIHGKNYICTCEIFVNVCGSLKSQFWKTPIHLVLQSGAAYHSQGFEDKNLGSSLGLLGQQVATVAAHQPGNSPNRHRQNLANDGMPNSVSN